MDLLEFEPSASAHEAGIDIEIIHPETGEKTGLVIHMCGPDSRRAFVADKVA